MGLSNHPQKRQPVHYGSCGQVDKNLRRVQGGVIDMANKDVNIKYKKCKFDFEKGLIVEYLKDEILEHRITDVFKDYGDDSDDHFFDLTIKESQELRPEDSE